MMSLLKPTRELRIQGEMIELGPASLVGMSFLPRLGQVALG